MENISYLEDENSLVILLNKQKLDAKMIDRAKRFFFLQANDSSHIPFVSTGEQKEIEKLLENPECDEFDSKNYIKQYSLSVNYK